MGPHLRGPRALAAVPTADLLVGAWLAIVLVAWILAVAGWTRRRRLGRIGIHSVEFYLPLRHI